jgi:DNA polymerase III subunit epsilon
MLQTGKAEFVAFDLETTGLNANFCRIVEFGAVRFRADGTELDRMQQLVDPGCRVPHEATAVHGITDAMLRGQPSVEQVLPRFLEFLGGPESVLLAHNAPFDLGFLSAAWGRLQTQVPKHPVVDTLALSRRRLRRLSNHRLETVGKHLRVAESAQHRALGDALMVKSVFLRLLAQSPVIRSLGELYDAVALLYFQPAPPVSVPAGYEPLAEAINTGRSIGIVYDGGTKGRRRRQITPKRLIENRGSLYLIAHCHVDGMEKSFRLDRILEMETT